MLLPDPSLAEADEAIQVFRPQGWPELPEVEVEKKARLLTYSPEPVGNPADPEHLLDRQELEDLDDDLLGQEVKVAINIGLRDSLCLLSDGNRAFLGLNGAICETVEAECFDLGVIPEAKIKIEMFYIWSILFTFKLPIFGLF